MNFFEKYFAVCHVFFSLVLASLGVFSLTIFSTGAHAQIQYIGDNVQIPFRSGASTEHRIIRFLNSGVRVEVNESQSNDEWSAVTLNSGAEGWVQNRYLENTPGAKQLLRSSEEALGKLRKKSQSQDQTIKSLKEELKALNSKIASLSAHSSSTDKELTRITDISKNAIRLDKSNQALLEENELLKASNENALQQVVKLESNQENQGMLYGVLAVLLGIILGWVMPKMRNRRSDAWV